MRDYSIQELLGKNNLIIYGAGLIAHSVIIYLKEHMENFKNQVVCCTVTDERHIAAEVEGVPVYGIDYCVKEYKDAFYIISAKKIYIPGIEEELLKRKVRDYQVFELERIVQLLEADLKRESPDRFKMFCNAEKKNGMSDESYISFLSRQLKRRQFDFEISVVDHCNLNCQCCNHFSPIADRFFLDEEVLQKDLVRLAELLENDVGKIMLLGGEPLLHPRLEAVVGITRKHMPKATIDIVTNGVLLTRMPSSFWECLNKNRVGLSVTKYPISFDYSKCEDLANKYGVNYTYGNNPEPIKTTYLMPINDNPSYDPFSMYMRCAHANYCNVLKDGLIYNCSFTPNVHYYNKYFRKNIPCEDETSISIYDVNSWEEIEEFLKRPNLMCAHCDICGYIYDIPWAVSKKDVYEWMGKRAD